MSAIDLAAVGAVQAYIGSGSPPPDPALIGRLITAASRYALSYMSRNIAQQAYMLDTYDGLGTDRLTLRQDPIISVSQVMIYAYEIQPLNVPPAPNALGYGYLFDQTTLYYKGGHFPRDHRNVQVSYVAGYPDGVVLNEPANVCCSPGPFQVTLLQGLILRAITSVVYAVSGIPLMQVVANPALGQYALNGASLAFNAADNGKALLISYTTNGTPDDLSQAVVEMVGYKFAKRNRLDKTSETLGGQTVAFSTKDMPDSVKSVFDLYKRNFYPQ